MTAMRFVLDDLIHTFSYLSANADDTEPRKRGKEEGRQTEVDRQRDWNMERDREKDEQKERHRER